MSDVAPAEAKLTPMMQRYLEVKREHPEAILLFRMGDFYELFYEDAQTAARVLGLTLTSRDKGSTNPVPMAGFPYHALDNYLRKLIQAGFRVSVCEQVMMIDISSQKAWRNCFSVMSLGRPSPASALRVKAVGGHRQVVDALAKVGCADE